MLPEEIKKCDQWVVTYQENIKRPVAGPKAPGFKFEDVATKFPDRGWGFNSKISDPYIIIDFDDVIEDGKLNPAVKKFLKKYPTYTTVSVSGKGLHAVYKSTLSKEEFKKYIPYRLKEGVKGEIRLRDCFTLFASDQKSLKAYTNEKVIAEIEENLLVEVFKIKPKQKPAKTNAPATETLNPDVPLNLNSIRIALNTLPLDKSEQLQKVYKELLKEDYSHYQFWLYIGMSVQYCGIQLNKLDHCFRLFLEWSKKDFYSYVSEDDVVKHWKSFSENNGITQKTLFAFYNRMRIWWPEVRTLRDRTLQPDNTSSLNIKALIEHYNLEFKENILLPFMYKVDGYKEVITKYFYNASYFHNIQESNEIRLTGELSYDELIPKLAILCRDNQLTRVKHTLVREVLDEVLANVGKYHPLKVAIDKVKPDMSKHTWRDVAKTLKIRDDFSGYSICYNQMVRCWLFQLIKNLYYRGKYLRDQGLLIVQGGAHTYKTTWMESLLPAPYNLMFIARNSSVIDNRGADKDTILMMKQKVILNFDEFENYLQNPAATNQLKGFMTGEVDTVRGIYARTPKTYKRSAIIGGTSNIETLPLPFLGIRRYWIIPIELCDTNELYKIDLLQVLANLKYELLQYPAETQHFLWQPGPELRSFIEQNARKFRGAGKLDTLVDNAYRWNVAFKNWMRHARSARAYSRSKDKVFKSIGRIIDDLEETYPTINFESIPDFKKNLRTILSIKCGDYTHTSTKPRRFKSPKCTISNGIAITTVNRGVTYPMPPRKDNQYFLSDFPDEDEQEEKEETVDIAAIKDELEEFDRRHKSYGLPSIII